MKRVMFICVGNSCRSQMAEGFAREYGEGRVEIKSAGTCPASRVSRNAILVMREKGIDLADHFPKPVDLEFANKADVIVTMGCRAEEACPATLFPKIVRWEIEDPIGQPIERFREIRDEIERRVKALLEETDS